MGCPHNNIVGPEASISGIQYSGWLRASSLVPFMGLSQFAPILPQGVVSSYDDGKKVVSKGLYGSDNYSEQFFGRSKMSR